MEKNFLKNAKAKSGVSLVVVMLFMLVATIAATATYKWISSQSKSSGSRMLEREAYQSSLAGIENARAWIAWHANDAGALIRQYFENDKRPIRMDRQLRALQREGQSYSVWLTGVNTEKSTYKLKLLSRGVARNGAASHSEVAILNVDGLYQVKIPTEKNASNVDFDYAYFGGSTNNHGDMNPTAMLVNGNWSGNPNTVTKNFVVTGNAELSGSNIHVGGTACIGGNLSTQNGFTGKNLYAAGNVSNFTGTLTGDAYLDGNFEVGSACGGKNFSILGNVTLNGTLNPGDCSGKRIEGNLCVAESGQLVSSGGNNVFEVHGNIWMPGDLNVWYNGWGDDNYDSYGKIVLGKKKESEVYIKTAHPWNDYSALRAERTVNEKLPDDSRMCTQYGNGMLECKRWIGWGWGARCVEWENASKCDHWDHWEGYTYSPYPEKAKQDGLYYLYAVEDGVRDVEFKSYKNTYWERDMAAYYVGGLLFYDTYSIWNEYHYSRESGNGAPTGSPYCKRQGDFSNGATAIAAHRPVCGVNPWFKSNGNVSRNLPAEVPFECAENVKSDCDSIWKKEPGCDGSNYKVEDMLVTAYSKFEGFADKDCAKNITQWDGDLSRKMNACYDEITKDSDKNRAKENLYNGYLVVKVSSNNLSTPSEALKGKFIIIVTNEIGQQNLPPTTSDSYVFLFLKEGGKDGSLQPSGSGDFNYFIYTEKDVKQILFNNSKLSGSVYASANTCSKVADLTIKEIEYNKELLEDLAGSGIICNNDGSPCGGSFGGSGSSSGAAGNVDYGGLDPHYISMAPQLGVTLESQYESREASPENANETRIDSAYIVLPRVVYLPSNPKGTLSDYFNVLALNGSKLRKGDVNVNSCTSDESSLAVSGALYSGTALQKGVYECRTSASGYAENVPFWVVVGSEESDAPSAYFAQESQGISSTGSASMTLVVEPFAGELTLKFTESDLPSGWNRSAAAGISCSGGSSGNCELKLNGTGDRQEIVLYRVTTSGATSGTFTVQLTEGEGYRIGSPWFSEVHISSNIRITRGEISSQELKDYCDEHSDECPELSNGWPKGNCESSEWVSITSGLACGTTQKNREWNCVAGGSGTGTLVRAASIKSGCVAIIPTENNSFDLSQLSADDSRELRASVYAKKRRMVVGFTGDVGGGNHPKIDIVVERSTGTVDGTCDYGSETDGTKRCSVDVFEGDVVTLRLDTSSTDHKNFNYWKCENADGNCPSGSEVLSNTVYPAFTIQGSAEYTLMAHFGEADGHCFFDEFNRADVICGAGLSEKEYCIDNCQGSNEGVCAGVSNGPTYSRAKWNLVAGTLGNILYRDGSVSVARTAKREGKLEQSAVRVMSTVTAGLYGTMKALVQIPKATSSADKSSAGIRNSGLVLRSNENASEYLMLNVYANASGNLEVQICNEKGDACKTGVLEDNGSSVSVSANAMVMLSATLASEESGDVLLVEAYKENYYGSPKAYSHRFALDGSFAKYMNRTNEYVGFGIADANFKIYGIGWKSEDYGSECHDTYPTVKCSFRAVAENGIIPIGKDVKPWLGHSAWFNSRNCSEKYFYENGSDACGASENGRAECSGAYRFSADGAGLHGYEDAGKRVKTAVALLHCSGLADMDGWALGEESDCGKFWTGEFKECSNHEILKNDAADYSAGEEKCEKFGAALNLRSALLSVELESVNGIGENPNVEFFLLSQNDTWGKDDFESQSVRISRFGSSSFDVVAEMTANADGFDPEHVSGVCVKNGNVPVRVKAITSNCANAISLSACRAEYAGGNRWNIEADVSNADKIQSFTVTRKVDGCSDSKTFSCEGSDSKCLFDAQTAKLDFADSRNPYKDDQGKSYAFQLSLVGNDGNAKLEKECSVSPSTIGKISATCKIDGSNSVVQGKGLPHFSVKFSGCPAKGCSWKITTDDGKIAKSGSGNFDSEFSGENSAESPWGAGTYFYKVESGDADYPFDGCSAEFTVTEAETSSSSEAAESSSSSVAAGESSSAGSLSVTCEVSTHPWEIFPNENYPSKDFYFMMKNNTSDSKTYSIEIYSGNNLSQSFELNAWSNWSAVNLEKLAVGTHTFSARYQGKEICSASVQVVSPLSCSVDKAEIELGDSVVLNTTYGGSANGCTLSGNGVRESYCNAFHTIVPTAVGTWEYIYNVSNGSNGVAACSTTVTVSEPAPRVECPDPMTKMVDSTASVALKSLFGCSSGDGCDWTLNDVNSKIADGKLKNGENFSFAGASSAGTKTYTFCVSNAKGSDECSFDVNWTTNVMVTVTHGSYQSFVAGKCYYVTLAGGSVWRCTSSASGAKIGTFNGMFMAFDNQNQSTVNNPGSGTMVEFCVDEEAPSDLVCTTDW